jgi:hypothetical protein
MNFTRYGSADHRAPEGVAAKESVLALNVSDESAGDDIYSAEKRHGRGKFLAILAVFFVLGCVAFFGRGVKTTTTPASETEMKKSRDGSSSSSSTSGYSIIATNEYGQFSGPYDWFEDLAGSQLVEPYKNTTLLLEGVVESSHTIKWITNYDRTESYAGNPVNMVFEKPGVYEVEVTVMDESGERLAKYSTWLICKYVKRELRSLTVADRERFLDAMAVMWEVSTEEGQEMYGMNYHSAATFVEEHAQASNDIRCDSFHEGSGFITHHLAITNSFEASLRSIDPGVTLHYWDFTIEGQAIEDLGEKPSHFMSITPFFSDTWFGSMDEDDHIQDSRWAHVSMPKVSETSSVAPNSYGYIRSYWNNNNDPEVTRHMFDCCGVEAENKKIPDCSSHYDVLDTETLGAFQLLSPSDGHGPLHVQIGGMTGGCEGAWEEFKVKWADELNRNYTQSELQAFGYSTTKGWQFGLTRPLKKMIEKEIFGEYFHIYRTLWRSQMCASDNRPNLLVCPQECSQDTDIEDCACGVSDLTDGSDNWENIFPCMLNGKNQAMFSALMPEEMIKDLVYMVGTSTVVEGEMLEAASPADVTFWVIHPTIDRLLSAKRLYKVRDMAGLHFQNWNSVNGSGEDWLSYSYYSQEKGENLYYSDAYTCAGHAAEDSALPDRLGYIKGFAAKADLSGDGIVSNWEYFLAIDPNDIHGVDYVYDNFDWDHCAASFEDEIANAISNEKEGKKR